MGNRSRPAWIALLLGAVLCAVPLKDTSSQRPWLTSEIGISTPFELQNGESVSLRHFSITATGGFHGFSRDLDKTGDFLVFVRDGSSDSETAQVLVRRTREPLSLLSLPGLSALDPVPRKWTVNGVDFMYRRFAGEGGLFGDRLYVYVYANIGGGDYATLQLESPASMWPESFYGFAALVATVRATE
jgi:hypothetical protein